jgi:FkbM family methyltransferase
MLIKFSDIVNRYGKPNGIIHIGAHLMEERSDYINNGVDQIIWIEANPSIYEMIKWADSDKERVFNYAITDTDGLVYDLNVTNNGESSSILVMDKHKEYHPHIWVDGKIKVNSKRMDTLVKENGLNTDNYDFLNLDIQGVELLAMKGFGDMISNFNYIYSEVNSGYLYSGCCLIEEIDMYLMEFGFKRVMTEMTPFEWGDALYIKC